MVSNIETVTIFEGFPARATRGYLGWSSVHLIKVNKKWTTYNYLFDTGGYNERPFLLEKLSKLSIGLGDIHGIILSHLHFDHAVNWTLFPEAQIYVNEKEFQVNKQDLAVPDFHQKELRSSSKLNLVSDGVDIEGMTIVGAPGHTPGMIALDIDGKVFASDAIKNRVELTHGPLGAVWDKEETIRSIRKLSDLAHTLYPGHDVPLIKKNNVWVASYDANETLLLAPDLLDVRNNNTIHLSIPHC